MKYIICHHVMDDNFTQSFETLEDALTYHRNIQQKRRWEYHIETLDDNNHKICEIHWQPILEFNVNGRSLNDFP